MNQTKIPQPLWGPQTWIIVELDIQTLCSGGESHKAGVFGVNCSETAKE